MNNSNLAIKILVWDYKKHWRYRFYRFMLLITHSNKWQIKLCNYINKPLLDAFRENPVSTKFTCTENRFPEPSEYTWEIIERKENN